MWSGSVNEFIALVRAKHQVHELRASLEAVGKVVGAFEEQSWEASLVALANLLESAGLGNHFLILECPMPGASHRADAVLLGQDASTAPTAVVIELKQWDSAIGDDTHWARFTQKPLNDQAGRRLHPCSQVQGYRDYLAQCSAALSGTQSEGRVHGCVYCYGMTPEKATRLSEGSTDEAKSFHEKLVQDCPAFASGQEQDLRIWLKSRIQAPPTTSFVGEFLMFRRVPSKRFADEMATVLMGRHPWILLEHQKEAWSLIEATLSEIKQMPPTKRQVILVTGQPGSGKTVLAMLTLLTAHGMKRLHRSALVATSSDQESALTKQFQVLRNTHPTPAARIGAEPIHKILDVYLQEWAKKRPSAKQYQQRGASTLETERYVSGWRDSFGTLPLPEFDLLVVDEAQGLADPSNKRTSGVPGFGAKWRGGRAWGPQAWHIIANSRASVFFMDHDQGYRQIETTHPSDIRQMVEIEKSRGTQIELREVSLGSSQFRLNGLGCLTDWLDRLMGLAPGDLVVASKEETARVRSSFRFVDDPAEMRNKLIQHARLQPGSARMLANYAWEWKSKADPSAIDSETGRILRDRPPVPGFCFRWLPSDVDSKSDFLLGRGAYSTAEHLFGDDVEKIAVVAYPLTVRGQEFRHVGVLWGQNLLLRESGWQVNAQLCPGTDYELMVRQSLNGDSNARIQVTKMVAQSIRILLTRGTETVTVWIEDAETRRRVRDSFDRAFPPK